MILPGNPTRRFTELILPFLVLAILLVYLYARFFLIAYVGFQFSGSNGEVNEVYVSQTQPPFLEPGDILTSINGTPLAEIYKAFRNNPLADLEPGDLVILDVQGPEVQKTIHWKIPGFNRPEFWSRMVNTWPTAYAFWLAGTAALLFVRPKDERRALLVTFNYITAIWFTAGGLSSWGVLASAFVLRAAVWLSVPIYLHFHWNFPNRMRPLPSAMWVFLYSGSLGMVIAQGAGWIERSAYFFGFLAAVAGSLLILVGRLIWRPTERREISLLFFFTIVAFAPAVAVAFYRTDSTINPVLPGLLFSIIALPGAYFYVVYRRQLGGLELRANRLITIYLFAVLLVTIALVIFPFLSAWGGLSQDASGAIVLTTLAAVLATSLGFSRFQSFVERWLLQIPSTPDRLLSKFAGEISTSISHRNLENLLKNKILPSLLVRQSALLTFESGNGSKPKVVYLQGLSKSELPQAASLQSFLSKTKSAEFAKSFATHRWVHLVLPLQVGGSLRGVWLLGRKDPDDYYHENERLLLASLANQIAIAVTNISQASNLRALHQADIERQESERIHLARELHDDLLPRINDLNNPLMQPAGLTTEVEQLNTLVRGLMAGLRPPLLDQGLYLALEQLVEDLKAKTGSTEIILRMPSSAVRFDPASEQHLFRIIQQTCENTLAHGNAKTLVLSGEIGENGVNLRVEDDGTGFNLESAELADLLKDRHFGLAGMGERAAMIGADLKIISTPGQGTKIRLTWHPGDESGTPNILNLRGR